MRSFLTQPYPFSDNVYRKLMVCGSIGIFVALFLVIFKPFGIGLLLVQTRWFHCLLFGTVTFAVSSFFQIILPKIFPLIFKEESWQSWKEIIFLLLTTCAIGAGNFWLMYFLYPRNDAATGFFGAELMALQIGIFPVAFVVFMKQMTMYRRFAADAKEATEDIEADEAFKQAETPKEKIGFTPGTASSVRRPLRTPSPSEKGSGIESDYGEGSIALLQGDGQKEELKVLPDNLFFIASADNYVQIHFRQAGALTSVLLRSSLKKMEEQLAGYSNFFRCHRMYIVNLQLVQTVSGNAQGLKLHLTGVEEAIPVSRSLTETVKERLHQLSHSPQNA